MRIQKVAAAAVVAILAVLAPACKHKEQVSTEKEKTEGKDIPREIAVGNLKLLLPRCTEVVCTLPKETLKASEIQLWNVGNDGFEVRPVKVRTQPLMLNYADITGTALEKVGKVVHVKLYSSVQRDGAKEHFYFVMASEEDGRNAIQLFEALRKKPQ
jgi:hypothetical protein